MQSEIVKVFDAENIAAVIAAKAQKAVDDFDMDAYVEGLVVEVFAEIKRNAVRQLGSIYGSTLSRELSATIEQTVKVKP